MSVLSVSTFVDFAAKTINIDQWGDDHIDMSDWVGTVHPYIPSMHGAVTDNSPVDMITWPASGTLAPSGMEHWQSCLNLMVHA